jgi:hypothetical protein
MAVSFNPKAKIDPGTVPEDVRGMSLARSLS